MHIGGLTNTESGQHQQMTWHPKPSLTVETLHWTSSIVDSVPFLSSSRLWDPDIQRKCKIYFIREHNFGPLSSSPVLFVFSPGETLLTLSLFKSGLTQGMWQLKPMSCIRLCVVVLEALTPAAVHFLWISPTFLNGFCFTILSRVRLSLLLVHFFLPHLSFPSLLMCLDTELCEQPASFALTFCVLPSLCKVSMVVFWTTVKSAVFPMIV